MTAKFPRVPKQDPAAITRSLTLLGATGSIGASTVDLVLRGHYRVEAVTAARNAAALAQLARQVGARFAAIADPTCYAALKEALEMNRAEARQAAGKSFEEASISV